MDPQIFQVQRMGLKKQMLEIPLSQRIYYEGKSNILFLNFEG